MKKYQLRVWWEGASTNHSCRALQRACGGCDRGSGRDEVYVSASVGGEAREGRPSRQQRGGKGGEFDAEAAGMQEREGPRRSSVLQGIVSVLAPTGRKYWIGWRHGCTRESERAESCGERCACPTGVKLGS
jgi:hypothetical protein